MSSARMNDYNEVTLRFTQPTESSMLNKPQAAVSYNDVHPTAQGPDERSRYVKDTVLDLLIQVRGLSLRC